MDEVQARLITTHQARIRSARMWIGLTYGLALGASAAMLALGLRPIEQAAPEDSASLFEAMSVLSRRQSFVTFGLLGLVVSVATLPIAILLLSLWSESVASGELRLRGIVDAVSRMSEQFALSDDARRVVYRKHERELLRRAIAEDIAQEDWDAASVLVKELAERFGYRADAEEFRAKIDAARKQTTERKVADAFGLLDGLIIQRRWDDAYMEAARMKRLYPDSPRVETVTQRVKAARDNYVEDLERRFLVAAQEERVEPAMELLTELDQYLTEQDAAPFREVARGVIGKARENLGAQFKLAVRDRRWRDAALTGERIISQFPNSRMAAEVRSIIDGVRTRATQVA
jgi:hypothetical protein